MRPRRRQALAVLAVALPLVMLAAVLAGSVRLAPGDVLGSLVAAVSGRPSPLSASGETILWSLRLPRVLVAALVGGGLAVVGATLQAVFRNPLADAGLLGVGPGAGLGAVIAVTLGFSSEVFLGLPLCAFGGALAASLLVYLLAHATGRPTAAGLLLTGVAVSSLCAAATSVLLVAAEEFRVKAVLFWLAGGLEGRSWAHARLAAAPIIAGCLLLLAAGRALDLIALGDEEAESLGLPVRAARFALLAMASLVAGSAVAVSGSVPFVGLIAPHALRPIVGPLARHLLPAAFLAGAVLVVVADLVARTASERLDLPLGSVTAVLGAPYFLLALRGVEGRE